MTETYKKKLEEKGIDWEAALDRFVGNEPLYLEFLMKFPTDDSFQKVKENMELPDTNEAFKAAHALKGVTGNLAIDSLYRQLIPFVEFLREGNLPEAKKLWPEIETTYYETVKTIEVGDTEDNA